MLHDFTYYNPTKVYFGKNSLENLEEEIKNYGDNILLAYGKNSVKKSGLYDAVMNVLISQGKNVVDFGGIKPNPTYKQVLEGGKRLEKTKST